MGFKRLDYELECPMALGLWIQAYFLKFVEQ